MKINHSGVHKLAIRSLSLFCVFSIEIDIDGPGEMKVTVQILPLYEVLQGVNIRRLERRHLGRIFDAVQVGVMTDVVVWGWLNVSAIAACCARTYLSRLENYDCWRSRIVFEEVISRSDASETSAYDDDVG